MADWRKAMLPLGATVKEAICKLDEAALQIVLVCDECGTLIGTVSDGDIRRGLLKGLDLNSSIDSIVNRNPLVVPETLSKDLILQLMTANKVRQLPIVDQLNHVVGLHLWDQFTDKVERPNIMVVMAGGKGTRLRPHTESCPKPMLEIAGKPMLEHILQRAKLEGFERFVFSIHYLGDMIENYFGNGEKFDVEINYLREEEPLGTAGALSMFEAPADIPFVVTNGDVITDIRYSELLDFHCRHDADATMAVRLHEWQHPFGVVQMHGVEIVGFEEKPISRSHINAGVYVLSPAVLKFLPTGKPCDMPSLFARLQAKGLKTIAYPMHEPWLDVGRPSDWALAEIEANRKAKGFV